MTAAPRLVRPRGGVAALAALRLAVARRGRAWVLWQAGLTAAGAVCVWMVASAAVRWALDTAEWSAVSANLRLFAVGAFPPEQAWRAGAVLAMVAFGIGLGASTWGGAARDLARLTLVGLVGLAALPALAPLVHGAGNGELAGLLAAFRGATAWAVAGLAACGTGWAAGRGLARRVGGRAAARATRAAWLLALPAAGVVLRGSGAAVVPPDQWGGLLLTATLTLAALVLAFPLGVILAIGRRDGLPLVRWLCVAVIEGVRGVPLVTVLYMASLLVPLVLPDGIRPGDVWRAIAGLAVFTAAYVAEDVRGGLAAVGAGQYEAARALGLGPVGTYRRVVLPQALRAVVPAMVGQLISLFKNTALAIILGLRELLGIARAVSNQPEFIGTFRETLVFIAAVFFVISYAMSRSSRRIERRLRADAGGTA